MNLWMGNNQCIAKYITQFTRLATQVRWGNAPLRYRFYNDLAHHHLKDRISKVGKPNNLVALRDLVQSIDNCYWERKAEVSHDSSSSKSGQKSTPDAKPVTNKSGSNSAGQSSTATLSKPNSGSTLKASKTSAKAYVDKLSKDGKLTPEERQQ
ncbi:hypothetical protein BD413DRAFT_441573, partial [Trametes elegans]